MENVVLACENCGCTTEVPSFVAELLGGAHFFCDACAEEAVPLTPSSEE